MVFVPRAGILKVRTQADDQVSRVLESLLLPNVHSCSSVTVGTAGRRARNGKNIYAIMELQMVAFVGCSLYVLMTLSPSGVGMAFQGKKLVPCQLDENMLPSKI